MRMYSSPWSRASDAFAAKGKYEERSWYGEEEKRARKNNLAYTIKAFPQTVSKEFKGLAHAELVLMLPVRFREEVIRFMQAHEQ